MVNNRGADAHRSPGSTWNGPALVDRAIGTVVLCVGVLPLIAERTTAILLPLFAAAAFVVGRIERQKLSWDVPAASSALAITLIYGALSSLWALNPEDAFQHVVFAFAMLVTAQFSINWCAQQQTARLQFFCFWLAVGFSLGAAYLVVEVVSAQSIRRIVAGIFGPGILPDKVYMTDKDGRTWIQAYELNRNVAVANLFLWPVLLYLASRCRSFLRSFLMVALFSAIFFATFGSRHESSKLALIASTVTLAVGFYFPRIAARTVAVALVAAFMFIVPVSIYTLNVMHLDRAEWLQFSARERVKIWGILAGEVQEAPLIGHGVRTAYAANLKEQSAERTSAASRPAVIPPHAHNAYLQVWYELGLVGAIGMLASGLFMIWTISSLPAAVLPFALATFVTGAVELAASWEVWQRWFFALLALSGVCTALVAYAVAGPVPRTKSSQSEAHS